MLLSMFFPEKTYKTYLNYCKRMPVSLLEGASFYVKFLCYLKSK